MDEISEDMVTRLLAEASRDDITKMVVGAAIFVRRDNAWCILIVRRAENDFLGGNFEIPGGGVDNDESLLDALDREVREETGLAGLKLLGYVGQFDYTSESGKRARQFNFALEAKDAPITLSEEEHSEAIWASRKMLVDDHVPMSQEMGQAIKEAFDAMDGA